MEKFRPGIQRKKERLKTTGYNSEEDIHELLGFQKNRRKYCIKQVCMLFVNYSFSLYAQNKVRLRLMAKYKLSTWV